MAAMTYDPQADAVTIGFGPKPVDGEEISPGIVLHFDADDRIVEIEILHASKKLPASVLAGLGETAAAPRLTAPATGSVTTPAADVIASTYGSLSGATYASFMDQMASVFTAVSGALHIVGEASKAGKTVRVLDIVTKPEQAPLVGRILDGKTVLPSDIEKVLHH